MFIVVYCGLLAVFRSFNSSLSYEIKLELLPVEYFTPFGVLGQSICTCNILSLAGSVPFHVM